MAEQLAMLAAMPESAAHNFFLGFFGFVFQYLLVFTCFWFLIKLHCRVHTTTINFQCGFYFCGIWGDLAVGNLVFIGIFIYRG